MAHGIRSALSIVSIVIGLISAGNARADVVVRGDVTEVVPSAPLSPTSQFSIIQPPDELPDMRLAEAVKRGMWTRACGTAARMLAAQEPDPEALGIFTVCVAVQNDTAATDVALRRLVAIEGKRDYYSRIAKGIRALRNARFDDADAVFAALLAEQPDNPLAHYFRGAMLRLQHKEAEALAAFKLALRTWPDHAPALAGAAQLTAAPDATDAELAVAISMAERAASIEPMNTEYWKEVAELYNRAGQPARAEAIVLQWLSPRYP